jgi:hypothetical protein
MCNPSPHSPIRTEEDQAGGGCTIFKQQLGGSGCPGGEIDQRSIQDVEKEKEEMLEANLRDERVTTKTTSNNEIVRTVAQDRVNISSVSHDL